MYTATQTINNFNEIDQDWLKSPLTFMHMNIRSLRKNFNILLSQIQSIINKTRLIILTETNIQDDENQLYQIEGYNAIFLNREGRGGGIVFYIQNELLYEQVQITNTSFESIRIDLKINNKNTSLISAYRPPNQNINTFVNELEQELSNIDSKQDILIVGDMNIDIHKNNVTTTKYLEMLASYGLQSMVRATTRQNVNNNTHTCIDHFFARCNETKTQASAVVITTTISDHFTIYGCVQNKNKDKTKNNLAQCIETKVINSKKVNQIIYETNWEEIIERSKDTNELFDNV